MFLGPRTQGIGSAEPTIMNNRLIVQISLGHKLACKIDQFGGGYLSALRPPCNALSRFITKEDNLDTVVRFQEAGYRIEGTVAACGEAATVVFPDGDFEREIRCKVSPKR